MQEEICKRGGSWNIDVEFLHPFTKTGGTWGAHSGSYMEMTTYKNGD